MGISLLEKKHIKDFLAFVTILINNRSGIHWKRMLALHPKLGIPKANEVIDYSTNVMYSIQELINKNDFYKENLTDFYTVLIKLNKTSNEMLKVQIIINYLEILWKKNREYKIANRIEDIRSLLSYLKDITLNEFINNLYLNYEVETKYENMVYLTTCHGSKGLEWSHVYLIDMDSKNFPIIWSKYYSDSLQDMEEERRLFYVSCSRPKKCLTITYHNCILSKINVPKNILQSPFIRELDTDLYSTTGQIQKEYNFTGKISTDVNSYLKFYGFFNIHKIIDTLPKYRYTISKKFPLLSEISDIKNKYLLSNFMDYLIAKMIQINFPNQIKYFDLNIIHKDPKFSKKIYHKYKDKLSDWKNMLEEIFIIATYKCKDKKIVAKYHDYLLSETAFNFYVILEKSLVIWIKKMKPTKIRTHYNISHNEIRGYATLLINDHLIEIKASQYETSSLSNLTQVLLYGYLLQKKDIKINKVSIYNCLNGTIDSFETNKLNFIKIKKQVYQRINK